MSVGLVAAGGAGRRNGLATASELLGRLAPRSARVGARRRRAARPAARDLHGRAAREHRGAGVARGAARAAVRVRRRAPRRAPARRPRSSTPGADAGPARRLAVAGAALGAPRPGGDGAAPRPACRALPRGRRGPLRAPRREAGDVAGAAHPRRCAAGAAARRRRRRSARCSPARCCERWSVFRAGFASARDPAYTVGPQRARLDAGRDDAHRAATARAAGDGRSSACPVVRVRDGARERASDAASRPRSRSRSGSTASGSPSRCARPCPARTPSWRSASCSARRSSRRTTSRASSSVARRTATAGSPTCGCGPGSAARRTAGSAASMRPRHAASAARRASMRCASRRRRWPDGPVVDADVLVTLPETLRARAARLRAHRRAARRRRYSTPAASWSIAARGRRPPQRRRQARRPRRDGRAAAACTSRCCWSRAGPRSRSSRRRCSRASPSWPPSRRPRASPCGSASPT